MIQRIGTEAPPTINQFQSYQRAFDYFNRVLWDGRLSPCMLQFSRRKATNGGHFAPLSWEGGSARTHEIAMNANVMKKLSLRATFAILVHEMAHQWQYDHGKKYAGAYHNKEWGAEMERIGLMPSTTGAPGGKKTGYRMDHYILEGGPYDLAFKAMPPEVSLPWTTGSDQEEGDKEKPANKDKLKYSCECSQVWGKSDLGNLWCVRCHRAMTGPGNQVTHPEWEWDARARGIVEALAKLSDIPVHFDAGSSPALNIGGPDKPFWGNWLEALVHVAEWMPRNGSPFDFGGVEIPLDVQPGVEALPHKAPQIELKEVPR